MMAFEKVNAPKQFHKFADMKKDEVICEGHFIAMGEDKFGNNTYEFKNCEATHVLNSSGHLNYLMSTYAQLGDYCRVTYKGTTKLPGQTSKTCLSSSMAPFGIRVSLLANIA